MKRASPGPAPGPPDPESETRFDSWKEIATYLRRDVSTVQRWEKRERLPVHRHVHDKRGSVYALRSELDSWLASRAQHLEAEEKGAAQEKFRDLRRTARIWLAVGALAVVAVFAATYEDMRTRAAAPVKIRS